MLRCARLGMKIYDNRYNYMVMKTIRQQIIELLKENELGANDLSRHIGIQEKEIEDHLTYVKRSVESSKHAFIITPAKCLNCGYTFKNRKRLSSPGRCPKCRNSHIQDPSFRIQ